MLKPGGVIVWVVADATKDGSETGSSNMEKALQSQAAGAEPARHDDLPENWDWRVRLKSSVLART